MKLRLTVLLLFSGYLLAAQQQAYYPLNHNALRNIEALMQQQQTGFHQALKPYNHQQLDTLLYAKKTAFAQQRHWPNLWDKLLNEDFIDFEKDGFFLKINPLMYLEQGRDHAASYFINTRAGEIKGGFGKNVAFYTSFYENQALYPKHIATVVENTLVVPGQGAAKIKPDKPFDFSRAESYLRFSNNQFLILEVGQGKHFIGHGFRSLLLSDNAFSMPYLKTELYGSKLRYTAIYTELQDFVHKYYDYHTKKLSVLHYLSWLPHPNFELGLFEATIMHSSDGQTFTNKPDWAYFIPLIGIRTLKYGLQNNNNLIAGLNLRLSTHKIFSLYAQLAIDADANAQVSSETMAYQIGIKANQVLQTWLSNHQLYVLAEYNNVGKYTYSHSTAHQNYSHYNQALAHPYGNNFEEITAKLHYTVGRWFVNTQYTQATFADWNNYTSVHQLLTTTLQTNTFDDAITPAKLQYRLIELGYMLLPATRLQIFVGQTQRHFSFPNNTDTNYTFAGLRTNINNTYLDF